MRPVRTIKTQSGRAFLAILLSTLALVAGALAVEAHPVGLQPVPGKDAPIPGQPDVPLAPAGNAFTYQGRLTQSGSSTALIARSTSIPGSARPSRRRSKPQTWL